MYCEAGPAVVMLGTVRGGTVAYPLPVAEGPSDGGFRPRDGSIPAPGVRAAPGEVATRVMPSALVKSV